MEFREYVFIIAIGSNLGFSCHDFYIWFALPIHFPYSAQFFCFIFNDISVRLTCPQIETLTSPCRKPICHNTHEDCMPIRSQSAGKKWLDRITIDNPAYCWIIRVYIMILLFWLSINYYNYYWYTPYNHWIIIKTPII